MKLTSQTVLTIALLISSHGAGAQDVTVETPADMELVWNDEFEVDGVPDEKKWAYEMGFVRNNEPQLYGKQNARVEGGMLIIEARRERAANPNYVKGSDDWRKNRLFADYTSSSLTTKGIKGWQYGRYEMRAKIDIRESSWPAFWTVGLPAPTRSWPHNGEVDIMEYYGGKMLANLFWGGAKKGDKLANVKIKPMQKYLDADPNWADKFHVWAMDWDAEKLTISMDGEILNTQDLSVTANRNEEAFNPFRAPQFIILNQAIGFGDPTKIDFPVKFEVDYVRVFQKK